MYRERVMNAIKLRGVLLLFQIQDSVFYIDYIQASNPLTAYRVIKELSDGCEWLCGRFTNQDFLESVTKRADRYEREGAVFFLRNGIF